ncbi:MAG: hypothetical protein IPO18_06305 [bacterium]|nr:hypothetical protein [bacterium]
MASRNGFGETADSPAASIVLSLPASLALKTKSSELESQGASQKFATINATSSQRPQSGTTKSASPSLSGCRVQAWCPRSFTATTMTLRWDARAGAPSKRTCRSAADGRPANAM